jgi:peptide/nickel transport system substrate-binding protein
MPMLLVLLAGMLLVASCAQPAATPTTAPAEEPTEAAAEPTDQPAAEPTDQPAAEPTDEPAAEPTDEATAESDEKSRLVLSMNYEPKFWNINYDYDGGALYLNQNVLSKLVAYDYVTWELHPDLAESWEVSPDGLEYTFNLREGVLWHDGEPFTSADVKWTIDSLIEEGDAATAYKYVASVEEVQTPDDFTVVFKLKEPDATFMDGQAAYYGFNILPKHLYEGTDVRNNPHNFEPVGTGPFKLVEHVPGSHALMEANEDYYGPVPYYDEMVCRFIQNRPTAMAALEAGELDYSTSSPPPGEVARLQALPHIEVDATPALIIMWFGFNFDREELADQRVRQAIVHAIDRDEIASKLYLGSVEPANTPYISLVEWAHNPDARMPEYDPEKAEQLLDEAGYERGSDGTRFSLTYTAFIASIWGGPEQAEMIKQYLGDVGIDVTVEVLEFALFNEKIRNKREFDLVSSGGIWGPDPNEYYNFVGSNGVRNVMGYSNERVDELFELGKRTVDQDERKEYYYEIQEIVAEEVPLCPIIEYAYNRPYRTGLRGFWWQSEAVGTVGQDMYNLVHPVEE